MGVKVFVEVSNCRGRTDKIDVDFAYSPSHTRMMKRVGGRSFVKTPRRHYHVPLDMSTCRQLRKLFGDDLEIGPNLYSWAQNAVKSEERLGSLAMATTANLTRLPGSLRRLYEAIHVGPIGIMLNSEEFAEALKGEPSFQAADVTFIAEALKMGGCLNGNQQGTGKTPEWIAAVWESGREVGNHLVMAPSAAVDGTWEPELEMWQEDSPHVVEIFACTGTRAERQAMLEEWKSSTAPVKWVVVNPAMARYKKDPTRTSKLIIPIPGENKKARAGCHCDARKGAHEHYEMPYPELYDIEWDTIAIDECHKDSIRNHKSLNAKSFQDLRSKARMTMSGTPMKRKGGSDIWGILHWLRPDVFTSYWRFVEQWFEVHDNGFGKKVGELRPDKQEAFFREMTPYMLRRLKSEVLPWLPPKHYVEVMCPMTPKQLKQYEDIENDAATRVGDSTLTTSNILAEYTRLSQFAFGYWEMRDGKLRPTEDSGKLLRMLEKMDEADVFEDSTVKQVVFSQYREVIELIAGVLRAKGVVVEIISGKQNKKGQRRAIREAFQTGTTQILCIVTQAGGVSLTLDMADTAHMLDEMWAPDENEQAEDRIHRASRIHQVTILQYRTPNSIDAYRREVAQDKRDDHRLILDVRRQLQAKYDKEAA